MSRSDESLRRIARERLHAVARPGAAPGSAPPGPGEPSDDDRPGPTRPRLDRHPAWLPGADAPPDGDPGDGMASGRGRHRSTALPADEPTSSMPPRATGRAVPAPAGPPAPSPTGPADHPPAPGGGLPTVPSWPPVATAAPGDVRDVVERMRREALADAAAQYGDRHGHPLEHPSLDARPARRRWFLGVRHAVVAGVAVALLTAGIVVRATAGVPEPVESLGGAASPVFAESEAASAADAPPPSTAAASAGAGDAGTADAGAGADATAVAGGVSSGAGTPGPGTATASVPGALVVHVVGQVGAPGVVRLPAGSRVQDALAAAGGASPTADLSVINLARPVLDGEQIVVPAPGEAVAPAQAQGTPIAGTPPGGPPAPVDVNAADLAALDGLPGIGPVLAQRILDWRAENGPFRAVDELGEVTGIGDALLGRLRPLVTV